MTTSIKLGTQEIIYQTILFTPLNSFVAMFIGLLHLILIAVAFTDDTAAIETDYPSIILPFVLLWLFIMACFKKFTLTEDEFIVEYPPMSFVLKPKRIPLNDIEKLVFKETDGPRPSTLIHIYRASSRWKTTYYFSIDKDDIQRLIDVLRSKGVHVECVGYFWK